MKEELGIKDLEFFYSEYELEYPIVVLLKIIFTFGLYIVYWMYKMNLKLEKADENAPNSRRGLVILYVLPPFVLFLLFMLKKFIFPNNYNIVFLFGVILWSIIVFLSLKYLYDFCECFGRWTGSSGLLWYLFIYPGYFSIILYFYQFYYTLPLLFFTIVSIPGMQGFLNIKERKFRELIEHDRFNRMVKFT